MASHSHRSALSIPNSLGPEIAFGIFKSHSCNGTRSTKVKVKITLEQEMKAQREVEI
jgi:hypothetical protein